MDTTRLGEAGLKGWRAKVGDVVAPRVAAHAPLSTEQARALIGVAFFALASFYVASTVTRIARRR